MTIKKKANKETLLSSIEEVISRGGNVTTESESRENPLQKVTLRISKEMLKKIDEQRYLSVKISRNQWILEAILNELYP